MNIRRFKTTDALFCFQIRCDAFLQKFIGEIGGKAVKACIEAYMPNDYIGLAEEMEFFIIENSNKNVGFAAIKRINKKTAEIPLIYFDLSELSKGYGSRAMKFIEEWIKKNWQDVNTIFLDTVIPIYNGGFYKKMGYENIGESICKFPDIDIPAVRFQKYIR